MRRTGIFLFTLLLCTEMTADAAFAQAKVALAVGKASAQTITPTSTPNTTQPTTNPTPAATQGPTPTTEVTTTPAPQTQVTQTPKESTQTQEPGPTATPTPVPPTPTPKPKAFVLPITKKPPQQPIAQVITAPFNLVMGALPYDYYNNQGLASETTRILLAASLLCLISGTVLLSWPAIVRAKKRLFLPTPKERKAFPYLAGKV